MDGARVEILMHQRNFAAASKLLREMLANDPSNWWATTCLALAIGEVGKLDEAIAVARDAVALDAGQEWAHAVLARCLLRCEQVEEALVHAETARRLAPRDARNYWMIGVSLYELKRF